MSTQGGELRQLVTLGMFIVDEFKFEDEGGQPIAGALPPQIGGGGTYASIGARIWLQAKDVGMIIDRGYDFPSSIQQKLDSFGTDMWVFRDDPQRVTTRALNSYKGDYRGFEYLSPRIRLTPRDLTSTKLERPRMLHFICSPTRALHIMSEVDTVEGWSPITIYEPIPYRCIPEKLPDLIKVLPSISVLSPNAEEALSLLSLPLPPTRVAIEDACNRFLEIGVGPGGEGAVVIRSGALGAYVATRGGGGRWVDAYWSEDSEAHRVVDVTGAGNAFLGGLAAGLALTNENIYEAMLYATVSASFIIEQEGLPSFSDGLWNGDTPQRRLVNFRMTQSRK